jgi:hypothetical protein
MLAIGLRRYGIGFPDLIRNDLRNAPQFLFNIVAHSRTRL